MNRKYILFLGDSLTYGYLVSSNKSFPSIIEKQLKIDGIKDIEIINAGNPGDTTGNALLRLEYLIKQYNKLHFAVVYLGANDYLLGEDTYYIYNNFYKIITVLKNHNENIKIFLIEFEPFDEATIRSYKDIYKKLLSQFPDIILIPDVLKEVVQNPGLVLSDGIHPNEKGYEIIAQKVYPYIKKEL